jgi:hypothetical protein
MRAPRVAATVRVAPHSAPHAPRVRQALAHHVQLALAKAPDRLPVEKDRAAAVARLQVTPPLAQALVVRFAAAQVQTDQARSTAPVALRSLTSNLPEYRLVRPACKIRHHEYSS